MCFGSEFQIIGAAIENERHPLADFMLGTTYLLHIFFWGFTDSGG